jgi:transcription elongation GreA/GreB family factor
MTLATAPSKTEIHQQLLQVLQQDLESVLESQKKTAEGATHEESRAENDKDTRGLEAGYLARGLAKRAAELQDAVDRVQAMALRDYSQADPVGLSALVCLEDEDDIQSHYFLAPAGAGIKIQAGTVEIRIVTPSSPLGKAMLGKEQGDDVEFQTPQRKRELILATVL